MFYKCPICQLELSANGGGWTSMHYNYTSYNNIEVAIENGEILNYVEEMIQDMKESQWVDNDYNKINRLTFCVYKELKGIDKKVAEQFLKKYKIRIDKGYKLALKDLEREVERAEYSLKQFKECGI